MDSSEAHSRPIEVGTFQEWGHHALGEPVALTGGRPSGGGSCMDHFENPISDSPGAAVCVGGGWELENGGERTVPRRTRTEVLLGTRVALVNSYGTLEIAERNGSAAARLLPGAVGEA